MLKDDQEYSRAFNDDVADESMGNEVSGDSAEGDSDAGAAAMMIDPVAAVDAAAEEAGMESPEQPMEQPVEQEAAAEGESIAEETAEQEMSPEDIQRQKSWEGRLRKREEELAAREAAMGNQPAMVDSPIDNAEVQAAIDELTADFGDRFVGLIQLIAKSEAGKVASTGLDEKLSPLQQMVDEAIQNVDEAFKGLHFGAIAEAHEDFEEIIGSPEFAAFIEGLSGEDRAIAEQTLNAGSPKQVIALLSGFKDSLKAQQGGDSMEDALDAAEGVRGSSPVSLPNRVPVGAEDEYQAAWNSM